jgi:hypothetical protein
MLHLEEGNVALNSKLCVCVCVLCVWYVFVYIWYVSVYRLHRGCHVPLYEPLNIFKNKK